jgi:hypothetical protein
MRDSRGLDLSGHDSSRMEDIYIRFYSPDNILKDPVTFRLLVCAGPDILFYEGLQQDLQISPEEVEERKEVCYQALWQQFLESL